MINLFKATVESTCSEFVNLNSTKHTDNLNEQLQKIYEKQQNLVELEKALMKNNISNEIHEVISFAYETSTELRDELNETTKNLLIASLVILVLSLLIYFQELRDKKQLQKAKSELREFVFALEESAIVSKTDLTGKITYVNNKFCEVSGYDEEELLGKPHNIVRHPDMKKKVFEELWDTISYGGVFHGTIKNRTKDGHAYYVDTTIIPLHDENGKIDEYLAVRYDVTKFIQDI
jgi:PAS domain S-box-containing protein